MADSQPSEYDKLFYPYLFEGNRISLDDILQQAHFSTLEKLRETVALRRTTLVCHSADIVAAGQAIAAAFAAGGTLFAFGNGGSATDAQDIVADLVVPARSDWAVLPAICLSSDISVITAVANDVGVDNIFSRQVIAFGKAGDIAVGISTSGNSRNVLTALEQAKKQGMLTLGLAGYDGGKMRQLVGLDYCIVAPGDHIPRIQEAQATVYHAIIEVIRACLKETPQ